MNTISHVPAQNVCGVPTNQQEPATQGLQGHESMQRAAEPQEAGAFGVASSSAGPCGNKSENPLEKEPSAMYLPRRQECSLQRHEDSRRAARAFGVESLNADPAQRDNNAIHAIEHEEDAASLFGNDDDVVPQGEVVEEGEPQQDGLQVAVQGPPEVPQEDFNPPKKKQNPVSYTHLRAHET